MYRFTLLAGIICSLMMSMSCAEKKSSADSGLDNTLVINEPKLAEGLVRIGLPEKLDYLINNLVLSDNMIMTLSTNANIFNYELLNKYENVSLYTTSRSKAINLGIYGADLNYLIHFGQSENSIRYLIASRQLAGQIGVAMAFDQETMEEYQSNLENKDALINIIFLAYENVKKMLKSEDQFLLSTLVITGSWIENMYLTTKLLPYFESSEIKTKLVDKLLQQREYLTNMYELIVELHEGDNIFVNDLLEQLNKIETVYEDFENKLLTEEDIKVLEHHVSELRSKLIQID
ncbi:MAG: hypothetical protein M0R02_02895 [Bacteroidales bacterium]|nr:hypothetical protein [Bacteroidales bacterium]